MGVIGDEQQSKVARNLVPGIREFVWPRLRLPRGYEREEAVENMEDVEKTGQYERHGGKKSTGPELLLAGWGYHDALCWPLAPAGDFSGLYA